MRKLLLILLVSFSGISLNAQTNLDSLYTVWQDETQPDSTRAKAYNDYIWDGFLRANPDTAIVMADKLIAFGIEKNYLRGQNLGLNIKGISFNFKGDYSKAIDYASQCLTLCEQLGDQRGIASSLNSLGSIYRNQGDYPKALDYFNQSLKIRVQLGNQRGISSSLTNIGIIYSDQGNIPKALDYFTQCLKIDEQRGDQRGIAYSLTNIGNSYYSQSDYPNALIYYTQSLKIKEQLGDQRGMASSLNNIGIIYKEQGYYVKALDYCIQGLKIEEQVGNQKGIAASLTNIGDIYHEQGEYLKAIDYCHQGYELAFSIGVLEQQKSACNCLFGIYKTMGNSYAALEYHEKMVVLNDSLFNEENTKKLTQLEMQYEFDKKEAATKAEQLKKDAIAAQELKRQKLMRNGFIGGFGAMLLFAGVFFTQRNRIKKGKKKSDELLLNILPEEVAAELKAKGHSDAQLIDQVTVLFTDFKGFTALSETLSPKDLVEDLHKCFSQFDLICEQHGIEKIKTIGDAYMAAGGLPVANATHAKDVVLAALAMAEVVENGKAEKIADNLPYFEMRVGVHSGPVVAGIVGVKKFQYDIWGDTVITASRMESSGDIGKVNMSQSTYELLKDDADFTFETRGKIEAKGKGEIDMYFVQRSSERV